MIRHSHIHLDIDEGIDRKELARLRGRFLSLNQTRLHQKGLISAADGGYLTSLGLDAAEHAQALLTILNSKP